MLNYLVMHLATTSEPGLMQVFEALHFPLTTSKSPQFGELPITRIGIGISTTRPSDARHHRERRVDRDGRVRGGRQGGGHRSGSAIRLKERLLEIARQQAPELV